jgi:DNA-binding transcriptional LysR family regulator
VIGRVARRHPARLPDLQRLRAFVVLAEEGDVHGAASRLDVTPSLLSRAVKKLQDEMDAVLFRWSRHRVELTDAGERLLPAARGVLDAAERLSPDLHRLGNFPAVPDSGCDELSRRRAERLRRAPAAETQRRPP